MRTVDIYYDGKLLMRVVMYQNESAAEAVERVKKNLQVSTNDK